MEMKSVIFEQRGEVFRWHLTQRSSFHFFSHRKEIFKSRLDSWWFQCVWNVLLCACMFASGQCLFYPSDKQPSKSWHVGSVPLCGFGWKESGRYGQKHLRYFRQQQQKNNYGQIKSLRQPANTYTHYGAELENGTVGQKRVFTSSRENIPPTAYLDPLHGSCLSYPSSRWRTSCRPRFGPFWLVLRSAG